MVYSWQEFLAVALPEGFWEQVVVVWPVMAGVVLWMARRGFLGSNALRGVPTRPAAVTGEDMWVGAMIVLLGLVPAGWLAEAAWRVVGSACANIYVDENDLATLRIAVRAMAGQVAVQVPVAVYLIYRSYAAGAGRAGFGGVGGIKEVGYGLWGLAVAMPVVAGTILLMIFGGVLLGKPAPESGHELLDAFVKSGAVLPKVMVAITAAVFAPILEELFFRGFLQGGLVGLYANEKSGRRWRVILVTSGVFVVVHVVPWQQMVGLFVFSVMLGWMYEKRGSLIPCVVMHMGFNALNLVAALLQGKGVG